MCLCLCVRAYCLLIGSAATYTHRDYDPSLTITFSCESYSNGYAVHAVIFRNEQKRSGLFLRYCFVSLNAADACPKAILNTKENLNLWPTVMKSNYGKDAQLLYLCAMTLRCLSLGACAFIDLNIDDVIHIR